MRITAIAMGVVLVCGQLCFGGYRFEWDGTVTEIRDVTGADASFGPVTVGDTVNAHVDYDPAAFDDGVAGVSDGLDYVTPATVWMWYSFSSAADTSFGHPVTTIRARDGGAFDQWNWKSGGDLLFQQNDHTDSCWDLPLPSSFADMHDLYADAFSSLVPSTGTHFVWYGHGAWEGQMWTLSIDVTDWRLMSDAVSPGTIPAPAAILLSGFGAGLVGWLRRRRSL